MYNQLSCLVTRLGTLVLVTTTVAGNARAGEPPAAPVAAVEAFVPNFQFVCVLGLPK